MSSPYRSVVYVSLGGRRMRAAKRYTADLAAAGAEVALVVADRPEWKDAEVAPGVTLYRVGSAKLGPTLRAARRLLLRGGGPLPGADLLVAGDPQATPIADAARRRFPQLRVALEPVGDPARRPAPADLAVLTPWYPSPDDPFAGAYVQTTTSAVADHFDRVSTLHFEGWFYPEKGLLGKLMNVTLERELEHGGGLVVEDTAEGERTRVATPLVSTGTYATWANRQIERMQSVLPTGRIEAPLIHAHTGHYAGVVAAALARDDARIIVTEHATFLDKVFAQPSARRLYGEMLDRVNRLLCVGQDLYDQVSDQFPQHEGKLRIVPNPIDFDRFTVRSEPPREPLRWLYVGRMIEHKGVLTLVDAFARIAAEEPRATLTLVGAGPLVGRLRSKIAKLGLGDRITQLPAVPPEDVAGLMREHDILVHASHLETFGLTIIEAVATGTPVLVARSQGPSETLHGLDGVAGVLFDVTEDPADIAEAYRRLRSGWNSLDLAAARDHLHRRYGREAVSAQLFEVYGEVMAEAPAQGDRSRGMITPPPPAEGTERITLIAIGPPGSGHTRRYIDAVREWGYGLDLIVLNPENWSPYEDDAGITLHGIGKAEEGRLTRRVERGVVTTFPRWMLGFLRARTHGLASPMPEAYAILFQRAHRMLAGAFNRYVYGRWYNIVRPRILWRLTRRHVVPGLDMERTRRVVVHGVAGVTTGWRLGKSYPSIPVTTDLNPPHEKAQVVTSAAERADGRG